MSTKSLLIVTALLEAATGIALLVAPSVIVELLLGAGLSSPQSLVLGRIAGAALVSIGVACWLARKADAVVTGLIAGMLIYNVAVPILLIYAAIAVGMSGVALWPASILHAALAIWCLAGLRPR
jgi:hypothetical protein